MLEASKEDERQLAFVRPGGGNVEYSYRVVAVGTNKNEQERISTKSQIDNRIECRWQTTQASLHNTPLIIQRALRKRVDLFWAITPVVGPEITQDKYLVQAITPGFSTLK